MKTEAKTRYPLVEGWLIKPLIVHLICRPFPYVPAVHRKSMLTKLLNYYYHHSQGRLGHVTVQQRRVLCTEYGTEQPEEVLRHHIHRGLS